MKRAVTNILASVCVLLSLSSVLRADSPARPTLYLLTCDPPPHDLHFGLLSRELIRQAVLIAARDQLGLRTRDQSLREFDSPFAPAQTLKISCTKDRISIQLSTGTAIWHHGISETWGDNLPALSQEMEADSRNEFLTLLQNHGWKGELNVTNNSPAPADAEQRLAILGELSQFAILRQTHTVIRADGESPARLGVLVRAYANLGQITRYHWSIEHDVYAARSLLYAQRMVAANPNSAFALWHRAYAFALAGLPDAALPDLKTAANLGGEQAPDWVKLLEPFCKYQTTRLAKLAADPSPHQALASFLAFLTVQDGGSQGATMTLATAALTVNPDCMRIADAMCDQTGPGMLNDLTEQTPVEFGNILGAQLEKLPQMPQSVIDMINQLRRPEGNPAGREAICQTLIRAADADPDGEPSWAVLGRMIQEVTFAQTERRAQLIAQQWGVDASDYVAEVRPLILEHPFRRVIDAMGLLHGNSLEPVRQVLADQPLNQITLAAMHYYYLEGWIESTGPGRHNAVFNAICANMDLTSFDLERNIYLYKDEKANDYVDQMLRHLRDVSANSPTLIVREIRDHWDSAKAAIWESEHGDNPSVLFALGDKYRELQQWSDAQRCLKNYIAISPDQRGYQALAQVYAAMNDSDHWLSTLKEFLQQPDYGLQHAQVQVQLAEYYMEKGNYLTAEPYADAAAETASAFGLTCSAVDHAGLGDWDTAESLIENEIDHYSESPYKWFAWCIRTGHGHRDAAASALTDYIAAHDSTTDDQILLSSVCLNVAQGNNDQAMKVFQIRMKNHPGPVSALHMAMICDQEKDFAARDAHIADAISNGDQNPPVRDLAKALQAAISAGPDAKPDPATIDRAVKSAQPTVAITVYYLAARYLDLHGHSDDAAAYLRRCAGLSPSDSLNYFELILADDALQRHGLNPLELERAARTSHLYYLLYP